MGTTTSAINTPLGQSIIGKTYITKIPVAFGYSVYDKVFVIREWEDRQTLSNPKVGEFWVKLEPGLIFQITDVKKSWGIDSGTNVRIHIEILNNMEIFPHTRLAESVFDPTPVFAKTGTGQWVSMFADQSNNPLFRKFANGKQIFIAGLEATIYGFQFFDNASFPDFNKPATAKITHLFCSP